MNDEERKRLVDAWIRAYEGGHGSRPYEENWWAVDQVLVLPSEDGEEAWKFIQAVLERGPLEGRVYSNLAAGPLEDLLAHHGPRFIDRIEDRARSDPDFRWLLEGVWQNEMTEEVWARVQAAHG